MIVKKIMSLDQTSYIESLAGKNGIQNANLIETPMVESLKCEITMWTI